MEFIKNKLKDLSTYTAVSGYEQELAQVIKSEFEKGCDSVDVDKLFNVIGIKKGSSGKKVMVTAHYDEIGLLVKSIDERGFIKFTDMHGFDSKILLAQEVIIHGKEKITGIIGAKPPHLLKPEESKNAVKFEDLSIDTGMSTKALKEIVSIGDVITLKPEPFTLQGNKFSSKSIDNRSGVVALLETMKQLSMLKHEADVYFLANTQEEVGSRGIKTAAYTVNPDIAIVIDAGFGDTPDVSKDESFALGKGPAIAIGPNLHKGITKRIIELAKEENIPYQIDVEPGDTGTDAWMTQVSRAGIPTILISIPVRYMHTTIETVHMGDIKNAAKLTAQFIARLGDRMEEILCHSKS